MKLLLPSVFLFSAFCAFAQPGPPPPIRLGEARSGTYNDGVIIDSASNLKYVKDLKTEWLSWLSLSVDLPEIPKEFEGFDHVERLSLTVGEKMQNLDGLKYFPNLTSLNISGFCGEELTTITLHLDSLEQLTLYDCEHLASLDAFKHLGAVKRLEVFECPSLKEFPEWEKGNKLNYVSLNNGQGFRHWNNNSKKITQTDFRNLKYLTALKELRLSQYSCLTTLPNYFPVSIERLCIMGKGYQEGFDDMRLDNLSNLRNYPNLKEVELFSVILDEIGGNFQGLSLDKMQFTWIMGLSNISELFSYDSIGTLHLDYCPMVKTAKPVDNDCKIDVLQMEKVPLDDATFLFECTGIHRIRITEGAHGMRIPEREKMNAFHEVALNSNGSGPGSYRLYMKDGVWKVDEREE